MQDNIEQVRWALKSYQQPMALEALTEIENELRTLKEKIENYEDFLADEGKYLDANNVVEMKAELRRMREQRSLQDVRICDLQDELHKLREERDRHVTDDDWNRLNERAKAAEQEVDKWKQRCLDAENDVEFEHTQFEKAERELDDARLALLTTQAVAKGPTNLRRRIGELERALAEMREAMQLARSQTLLANAATILNRALDDDATSEDSVEKLQPWNRPDWPERSGL